MAHTLCTPFAERAIPAEIWLKPQILVWAEQVKRGRKEERWEGRKVGRKEALTCKDCINCKVYFYSNQIQLVLFHHTQPADSFEILFNSQIGTQRCFYEWYFGLCFSGTHWTHSVPLSFLEASNWRSTLNLHQDRVFQVGVYEDNEKHLERKTFQSAVSVMLVLAFDCFLYCCIFIPNSPIY